MEFKVLLSVQLIDVSGKHVNVHRAVVLPFIPFKGLQISDDQNFQERIPDDAEIMWSIPEGKFTVWWQDSSIYKGQAEDMRDLLSAYLGNGWYAPPGEIPADYFID